MKTRFGGLVSALILASIAEGQDANGPVDLKVAQAAWDKREQRVASLRASLNKESTIHRNAFLLTKQLQKTAPPPPDKDVLATFQCTLTIKGPDYFKYSYTGHRWSPDQRGMQPVSYTALSNPDIRSFFEDRGPAADRPPSASESKRRTTSDETTMELAPLMLAVRPSHPNMRRLSNYLPSGKTVLIEGRPCVELRMGSRADGETSEYLYLDQDRDWVVARIDMSQGSTLVRRLTINYAPDATANWLPTSWSYITRTDPDTPLYSGKVTVTNYDVNLDIPDSEFRRAYPPGTFVVTDDGAGEPTVSVVNDDGRPGVSVPLSEHPSYQRLVEANRSARRQWLWLAAIGTTAAVVGVGAYYRFRRRGSKQDNLGGLVA